MNRFDTLSTLLRSSAHPSAMAATELRIPARSPPAGQAPRRRRPPAPRWHVPLQFPAPDANDQPRGLRLPGDQCRR